MPTDTLVFTLPNHTLSAPLSCETFRGEPATRRFDWSFAPTPRSHDRFERQNRYVPPPAFPQASHCPGIAHRLSGLTTRTKSHSLLARPVNSLARVSRRVQHVAFRMLDFTSLPLQQIASFTVLIRYRSLIVFSLWCLQPPLHTALPNSATQYIRFSLKVYYPLWILFSEYYPTPFTTGLRHYHRGFSNFARRYYRNHCCFLFLLLLICLSPKGSRRHRLQLDHGLRMQYSSIIARCCGLHRPQCQSILRA